MTGLTSASIGDLALRMESGFACSKAKLVADGIPHLRPFNVGRDGRLSLHEVHQIPLSAVPRGRDILSAGEILFNNTNSDDLVGKSALIEQTIKAGFSNHMTRVVINTRRAEPGYVAYALDRLWQSGYFRRICTRWVSQSAVNTKALAEVQIALPALEEQRRIVDILDRAASIRKLRGQAQETARQIIPALFTKMFGDPSTNPRGWRTNPFGDLLSGCDYGTSEKSSDDPDGIPVIRMGNVTVDGRLNLGSLKYFPRTEADLLRYGLERGDLLFNRTNSKELVGKMGMWDGSVEALAASYFIRCRVDRTTLVPEFVWVFFNTPFMKRRLFETARGA